MSTDQGDMQAARVAFVHVPKTAGTAVTEVLSAHFGAATCPAMTTLDFGAYDTERLAGYRFYKGHAYRRDYERLPAGTIRFTVLRDPVERAASYYGYYRQLSEDVSDDPFVREAIRLAKTCSAPEYVYSDSPFVIEHLRLGQVRQFLSESTLREVAHRQFLSRALQRQVMEEFAEEVGGFDYALSAEGLALSWPVLARELGLARELWHLPDSNVGVGRPEVDRADLRRALVDVSGAEFECYAFVRRREEAWMAARLRAMLVG